MQGFLYSSLLFYDAFSEGGANVVLDTDGNVVVDNVCHGFDENVKQQIREYMNPQSVKPVPQMAAEEDMERRRK